MPLTLWITTTALLLAPPQDDAPPDYTDALRLVDDWLDAQREFDRLPGLSAGIVVDQELAWSAAYGHANPGADLAARTDTIYSICSISKLFTAVAIMQLVEAGELRLDDTLAQHLPEFDLEQRFPGSAPITIRSVLTHSSGLPRESDIPYWTPPDFPFPTRDQVQERLGEQATLYPASTYYQYSNLGLGLLGDVVAELSGTSFEDYVARNILTPLRMADTRTHLPEEEWGQRLAVGHGTHRRDGALEALPPFQARGLVAAFGMSSTVEDLARFASWQFRLLGGGEDEILRASTLREMHRVQWIDPDWKATRGLGFGVWKEDDRSHVGHGGFCPGYRTQLTLDPKHALATIVMINASTVQPTLYGRGMRALLKKARDAERPDSVSVDLEAYAGRYDLQPWGAEVLVVPWYGQLAALEVPTHDPAGDLMLLRHVEGDTFRRVRVRDDDLGEEVVFERDAEGRITGHRQHSNLWRRLPDE